MNITKKEFGILNNEPVYSYFLDNKKGLCAEILSLGGILRRLTFNGIDVVLGRDTVDEYFGDGDYFGALVGRNSNRIEDCTFYLNGKTYNLNANDSGRNNNLHGGTYGFSSKIWNVEVVDADEPQLVLSLFSPDGEEGFPGNVNVKVTYTLTAQNSVMLHYEAETDADTLVNLTNHSYFNLNGHTSGNIRNHTLMIDSDFFTPNKPTCVPDGRVLSVSGTAFDFRTPQKIGADIGCDDEQIVSARGYDHNFALNGRGFRKFAEAEGDISHITMECFTDLPAVQFYSGNYITPERGGKDGELYTMHNGFCLETQVFPNAMKFPYFPSPILKKGEKYSTFTEYKFSQK